jgi:hypothetical protein
MDFETRIKYKSRTWNNAYEIALLDKEYPSIEVAKSKIINFGRPKISHQSLSISKKKI